MANNVFFNGIPVEIERKYLIKMPDLEILKAQPEYDSSIIEQIYILENGVFCGGRIRKRIFKNQTKYYETHKKNINGLSKFEIEEEITADVYEQLSHDIVPKSRPIRKTRHCFAFKGQLLELDIYEFWKDNATVEVELGSEQQTVILPDFIEVIADVTGNRNYSNYSLSFNNSIF